MAFACIHVPDFLVQSLLRAEPSLRDCAIALISGNPPLWSVVAANPAAFQAGIQLSMTKSQAEEFCAVQIRHRSESQERTAHAALLDVGRSVSPRVEDTAPDTIVLDLDGLGALFGSEENIVRELAQRVSNVGVVPRIAVASNIEVAIHAARGLPGITIIPTGEEFQCLSSLPVHVLSTGPDVLETLERWGVDTLQALAGLPVLQLSERLGQEGVRLHKLAQGAYIRSLILALPSLHFEEEMELDNSVEELEPLSFLLGRLLAQLCARLEARALAVRAVHIRFDLEPSFEKDFQALKDDSRKKIAAKQYTKVLNLPVPMWDSKMLLKLLRLQLQSDPPRAPIQKIVLAADSAAPRVVQGGMFVPCAPDPEKLELTIARLAKLVGDSNVGSPELLDTHRPDNFRMSGFLACAEQTKRRQKKGALPDEGERLEFRKTMAGFRAIRPAVPVTVELREERPMRVCLRGIHGEVVAASGPWRSSGDWWQEDAWDQKEWELAIDFGSSHGPRERSMSSWPQYGVYRIYHDALRKGWFVRGLYD
jgi:protein ImuB